LIFPDLKAVTAALLTRTCRYDCNGDGNNLPVLRGSCRHAGPARPMALMAQDMEAEDR
jgi:hypothetical protein